MEKDQVEITSRSEWRDWLEKNHTRSDGIWLITYKKQHADLYVPIEEVIEESICFGWIDSLSRKLDEDRSMLWLAPRRKGSNWSKPNKYRVERMIAAGLMTDAGLVKIDLAKQDGSWTALDAVEALVVPDDLRAALAENEPAEKNFAEFPRSVKRGILEWIANARRSETRKKRVEETARLAKDNIRANQWRIK
jgi:uncharacterized protein YdeI (YjbR/CyaY-like superfamily)